MEVKINALDEKKFEAFSKALLSQIEEGSKFFGFVITDGQVRVATDIDPKGVNAILASFLASNLKQEWEE